MFTQSGDSDCLTPKGVKKNHKTEGRSLVSPFIISHCSQGNLYLARVPFEDNDDIFYAVGSFSFRPATEAESNGKGP